MALRLRAVTRRDLRARRLRVARATCAGVPLRARGALAHRCVGGRAVGALRGGRRTAGACGKLA